MATKTIDITPTWTQVLPALIAVLTNEDASHKSREFAAIELERMATFADYYVLHRKGQSNQTENV